MVRETEEYFSHKKAQKKRRLIGRPDQNLFCVSCGHQSVGLEFSETKVEVKRKVRDLKRLDRQDEKS
jgi:hypothetical protein